MKDNELIIYDLISPLKSLIKEIEQKNNFERSKEAVIVYQKE